ncbi:response regulator [Paenibacillaceae bacterium]|nr:response regulator [Paenibacillaceae bacterium]
MMSSLNSNHKRPIRMMIVDDEPIICEGLQLTIDWQSMGAEVVGVAYDGEQALQMAQQLKPDILLTDIRMDGMDGLELAKQLRDNHPNVRVVMISGYEDFEYARRAVRLGVTDYLLKPVDIEELVNVVKQSIADIYIKEQSGTREEEMLWFLSAVRNTSSYTESAPPSHSQWYGSSFRIIASQLADFASHYADLTAQQYKAVQEEWIAVIRSSLNSRHIRTMAVFDHKNLLYTLAITEDGMQQLNEQQWIALLEQTMNSWQRGGGMYCAVTSDYEELGQTAGHCADARQLLQYHVLRTTAVLHAGDCDLKRPERSAMETLDAEWAAKIKNALFRKALEEVETLVHQLFFAMRQQQQLLLAEALKLYTEQMVLLRQLLRQNGLEMELDTNQNSAIDLHMGNSYPHIEAIAQAEMRYLFDLINQNSVNKSYWIVEKAMKYIADHSHEDLKASEVAAWLKITPSHFSFIFNQSTNKNFKEYMNELRIEQAKELLATTHDKVFEIADQVGYKEYKYFVSVFKTVTGMTPKEFRTLNAKR